MIAAERPQQNEHQDNLKRIATLIHTQTDKLAAGVRTTVETAREIGLHLIEAKKLLKAVSTTFESWVGDHCRFSYITACRYVRLAENWDKFTDYQKGTRSIPQLLDQVAGYRRTARPDGTQFEKVKAALTVVPSNMLSGPSGEVVPPIKIMGTEMPLNDQPVTETRTSEANQQQVLHASKVGRSVTVTPAQVHQAAAKYELDYLVDAVPANRLVAFLAELGVTVQADPVPAAP